MNIMGKANLIIGRKKWLNLIDKLKFRGQGIRESGAVLLGAKNSRKISDFICLDELDPNCYQHGAIKFSSQGYSKLWEYCKNSGLVVKADVHTHPSFWIGLSEIDINNPFVSLKGHIAIVIPYYAQGAIRKEQVGIFLYKGGYVWTKLNKKQLKISIL